MKEFSNNNQKGFVALFAVLVSSILLLMALSITGVAYKEQLLSINAKSSQYSFTAADSGLECGLYSDVKQGAFGPGGSVNIKCGGDTVDFLSSISTPTFYAYKLRVEANVNGATIPGCSIFTIDKNYNYDNGDGTFTNSTKIDSRGYNVNCDNIEYGQTIGSVDLRFINGAGARAVERFLSASYSN